MDLADFTISHCVALVVEIIQLFVQSMNWNRLA